MLDFFVLFFLLRGFLTVFCRFVFCVVQRDGKEVQVKRADGEADYYSLSATWMVSSIERSFLKAKASLYSDTDDIENDMKELFRLLSNDQ